MSIVNIFRSIYIGSSVQVYFNGKFSSKWNIFRGIRQGGITSAFLFNLYIDDIVRNISSFKVGCYIGLNRFNIQAYADDIVLLSSSVSSLQFLIDEIAVKAPTHLDFFERNFHIFSYIYSFHIFCKSTPKFEGTCARPKQSTSTLIFTPDFFVGVVM